MYKIHIESTLNNNFPFLVLVVLGAVSLVVIMTLFTDNICDIKTVTYYPFNDAHPVYHNYWRDNLVPFRNITYTITYETCTNIWESEIKPSPEIHTHNFTNLTSSWYIDELHYPLHVALKDPSQKPDFIVTHSHKPFGTYCLNKDTMNHFCGEYQAVKTLLETTDICSYGNGPCYIINRDLRYFEDLSEYYMSDEVAAQRFHTQYMPQCINEYGQLVDAKIIIMDDTFIPVPEFADIIRLKASGIEIDHTRESHTMFINVIGSNEFEIKFTPKDGHYQFDEYIPVSEIVPEKWIPFMFSINMAYGEQCGIGLIQYMY